MPPATRLRVRQATGRITAAALSGLDHLIVLSPQPGKDAGTLLRALPALKPLTSVAGRLGKRGAGQIIRGRVGTTSTGISWLRLPAPAAGAALPETFRLLRLAGELVADGLSDHPRSLGVIVLGLGTDDQATAVTALLHAIGARMLSGPAWQREAPQPAPRVVHLLGLSRPLDLTRVQVEIDNSNLVRWLASLPANKLTAAAYRGIVQDLAARHGWEYRFLDETALARLGAGAFLAVAQGNAGRDAGIIHLRYRPQGTRTAKADAKPAIALVGKGILFDTGGNNLKPAKSMADMHMDMAGSAVALAVLRACTELALPVPVDCWLAVTENRIGPAAFRQRDILTAVDGTTIEVVHTDAEGRLVLADTLALAGREQPRLLLDFATLTGACVHALTERYSGVFTNRAALERVLVDAGRSSGERVWPFPMDEDFDEDLKSKVADVAQCTMSGEGDHILAARFLQRFVPKGTAWVHVDLASVMRKDGLAHVPGGATGFGVRLSLALLLDHAAALEAGAGELGLAR